MDWWVCIIGLWVVGFEAVTIALLWGRLKTHKDLAALWEGQARKQVEEIRELVNEFKLQKSSLEGALRTVRAQRDQLKNRLYEAARRDPKLAVDLFNDGLREAQALDPHNPRLQLEVLNGGASKPEGGSGGDGGGSVP